MPTSHDALYRAIHAPALREVVTGSTTPTDLAEGDGYITVWADGVEYPFASADAAAMFRAQFPSAA